MFESPLSAIDGVESRLHEPSTAIFVARSRPCQTAAIGICPSVGGRKNNTKSAQPTVDGWLVCGGQPAGLMRQ